MFDVLSCKVCAIRSPGLGDNRRANLADIGVLTGGEVSCRLSVRNMVQVLSNSALTSFYQKRYSFLTGAAMTDPHKTVENLCPVPDLRKPSLTNQTPYCYETTSPTNQKACRINHILVIRWIDHGNLTMLPACSCYKSLCKPFYIVIKIDVFTILHKSG
ncbi:uncharacterized protein LOC108222550 [Daucus carota subsp. sativus]|uniref:uncharacterized protein LOC108222550 n=1 Tax=Daucus carota subsp. sativus TaxID=79200 RepID=UPI0030829A67